MSVCAICLDEIREGVDPPSSLHTLDACGHCFHSNCLIGWLKQGRQTCPSCRSDTASLADSIPSLALLERASYLRCAVARRKAPPPRLMRQIDKVKRAEDDLVYALLNDGTDRTAHGWLVVANIRQARAEAASDPSFRPNGADGRAAWTSTLEAADLALAADPLPGQKRAATWHRASALLGLEEVQKADELMAGLAEEGDAWGLLAKNRRSSLQLEQQMDTRTKAR